MNSSTISRFRLQSKICTICRFKGLQLKIISQCSFSGYSQPKAGTSRPSEKCGSKIPRFDEASLNAWSCITVVDVFQRPRFRSEIDADLSLRGTFFADPVNAVIGQISENGIEILTPA